MRVRSPHRFLPPKTELSPRQQEVANLIRQGKTNPEIAEELSLAYGTVLNHVAQIFKRTGLHDRMQLLPDCQIVHPELTEHQQQILNMKRLGMSNKEIAHELNIKERTVKNLVNRIYRSLDVRNRYEACLMDSKESSQ